MTSTRQRNRSDGCAGTVIRGFWWIASKPHATHEVSEQVTPVRDSLSGQVAHHPATTAAEILQVESGDLGHYPEGRFAHR